MSSWPWLIGPKGNPATELAGVKEVNWADQLKWSMVSAMEDETDRRKMKTVSQVSTFPVSKKFGLYFAFYLCVAMRDANTSL